MRCVPPSPPKTFVSRSGSNPMERRIDKGWNRIERMIDRLGMSRAAVRHDKLASPLSLPPPLGQFGSGA